MGRFVRLSNRKQSNILGLTVIYSLLSLGLVFMIFPYVWMILASFKIPSEIYHRFIPTQITLEHYQTVFSLGSTGSTHTFIKSIFNSLFVSSITTVSVVFFGALTGYALARLNFPGKTFFNNFVLFQMLFPVVLFLIPRFLLMLELGWINTYQGMMAPFMISAWAIFLFTQFFKTVPQALIDAARIDGCSELRIIFKIILPLSKSVTMIIAIFTFMAMWDEFFQSYDVLLCPVMFSTAFAHDHNPDLLSRYIPVDGEERHYSEITVWPSLATIAHLPATVIPIGQSPAGLPIGLQVIGPYLEDYTTIALARAAEGVCSGFTAPPPAQ